MVRHTILRQQCIFFFLKRGEEERGTCLPSVPGATQGVWLYYAFPGVFLVLVVWGALRTIIFCNIPKLKKISVKKTTAWRKSQLRCFLSYANRFKFKVFDEHQIFFWFKPLTSSRLVLTRPDQASKKYTSVWRCLTGCIFKLTRLLFSWRSPDAWVPRQSFSDFGPKYRPPPVG